MTDFEKKNSPASGATEAGLGRQSEMEIDVQGSFPAAPAAAPSPDSATAISFLQQFHPQGPWVLTGISPDKKSIQTRNFHPGEEAACRQRLDERNGKLNIYFHVIPPLCASN